MFTKRLLLEKTSCEIDDFGNVAHGDRLSYFIFLSYCCDRRWEEGLQALLEHEKIGPLVDIHIRSRREEYAIGRCISKHWKEGFNVNILMLS